MDSCRWNWFEIVRMLLFYTNIVFNLYFEIWQAWKPWHHQTESPYFFQFVEALPVHSSRFDRSSQSYSITIRLFNLTQPKWLFSFVLTDRFRDSSHFIWLEAKQGFQKRKEKTKQNVQAANQSTNLFLCLRSYRSMISRRLPIFSVYSFQDVCVRSYLNHIKLYHLMDLCSTPILSSCRRFEKKKNRIEKDDIQMIFETELSISDEGTEKTFFFYSNIGELLQWVLSSGGGDRGILMSSIPIREGMGKGLKSDSKSKKKVKKQI